MDYQKLNVLKAFAFQIVMGIGLFIQFFGLGPAFSQSIDYLPTSTTGQVVEHSYYTLSYSEKHEQAEWVAYFLNRQRVRGDVDRTDNYRPDPKVKTGSSTNQDHEGSGYDRGHLAPAAAMAFSRNAMSESFYLSNMSPQEAGLNRGIWRQLEKQVRKWASKKGTLYVVTGPSLIDVKEKIGINGVSVPGYFYKVLWHRNTNGKDHGIGFWLPNKSVDKPLKECARSIDKIESLTGINFFHDLSIETQKEFERNSSLSNWPIQVAESSYDGSYQPENHYTNASDKININAASSERLQRLYGFGPVTAKNIIAARPYQTVSDLKRADGIGPATFEKVEPYIRAGSNVSTPVRDYPVDQNTKLNLNTASRSQLKSLDGIGEVLSKRIMQARPFSSVNQLTVVHGIGPKTLADVKPEVTVR